MWYDKKQKGIDITKEIENGIALFYKKYGHPATAVEMRTDEYNENINLEIPIILIDKGLNTHQFRIGYTEDRLPVINVKRTPYAKSTSNKQKTVR